MHGEETSGERLDKRLCVCVCVCVCVCMHTCSTHGRYHSTRGSVCVYAHMFQLWQILLYFSDSAILHIRM